MSTAPEYLLAIYIAQHRDEPPVAPGNLGEMLDRSPAAVTEMCQRLAAQGLVSYEPYDGVTLTEAGHEEASELHETYVTVSWFFRGVLDLDDHETEAMELAGLVSPMVAKRLAATLPCNTEATDSESAVGTESAPSDTESA
ncbi:metal-dependent transcriptional regulator [Haloarcula sp. CBA1130]|uniref:metal-dependent transcriptional regulator n=1 Tax=unclassified Haloarcula TaxID=2624677 RepID=UPI0012466A45|nr:MULTISPECIES: metal-dependent transcriptional regulator [unclassified Haloarcula]KAA9399951.1 metal-dependent transcriptional regulator [Haloarcula sp. CBA1129]KAA9401646.1 metal-dependent transcriptional regulator [Haloarcula sp. CBA1130]